MNDPTDRWIPQYRASALWLFYLAIYSFIMTDAVILYRLPSHTALQPNRSGNLARCTTTVPVPEDPTVSSAEDFSTKVRGHMRLDSSMDPSRRRSIHGVTHNTHGKGNFTHHLVLAMTHLHVKIISKCMRPVHAKPHPLRTRALVSALGALDAQLRQRSTPALC